MPRRLVPMPTKRAAREEPVFVEQEPVISHQHRNEARQWNRVPYPYQFKWDGGFSIFVLMLFCMGIVWHGWWLLAGFIAVMRVIVWLSFRFPMTMMFFAAFVRCMTSRRRW